MVTGLYLDDRTLAGMSKADMSKMPPHVASLFEPRPPVKYVKPIDAPPEKRATAKISGVASYLNYLNSEEEKNYIPTKSWLDIVKQQKREKQQKFDEKLEHDKANWDPNHDAHIRGDPYKTLFLSRLSYDVNEQDLDKEYSKFGPIERIRVVNDSQSGKPRGYAFIVFEHERDMTAAIRSTNGMVLKGRKIIADVERGRTVKDWKPRKLGGGKGGRHYTKRDIIASRRAEVSRNRGNGRPYKPYDSRRFERRGEYSDRPRDSYRDSRDDRSRDSRESYRDSRDSYRDSRDSRDSYRDSRDSRDSRDPRDSYRDRNERPSERERERARRDQERESSYRPANGTARESIPFNQTSNSHLHNENHPRPQGRQALAPYGSGYRPAVPYGSGSRPLVPYGQTGSPRDAKDPRDVRDPRDAREKDPRQRRPYETTDLGY